MSLVMAVKPERVRFQTLPVVKYREGRNPSLRTPSSKVVKSSTRIYLENSKASVKERELHCVNLYVSIAIAIETGCVQSAPRTRYKVVRVNK